MLLVWQKMRTFASMNRLYGDMKRMDFWRGRLMGAFLLLLFAMNGYAQDEGGQPLADTTRWAIVNVSCCNLRTSGDYDAGMESQALLGMPLRVDQDGTWLKVRTPDEDPAWVLHSSVVMASRAQLERWNHSPQVVVTAIYGFVYQKPSRASLPVSDVVASNRFRLLAKKGKFYQVEYPDGRQGYLPVSDAQPLDTWRKGLKSSARSIIATAKKLSGIPYMWGGTSTKGVDCSGFIRTVLLQHDIIIPRNASQQARKGEHIEIAPDFGNLIPGDLVFFGRKATDEKPAHVSHVGMYIGKGKFIHSLGFVHISSFYPKDPEYDEYDLNRLLWAQRVLPFINKEEGLTTTDRNEYYR